MPLVFFCFTFKPAVTECERKALFNRTPWSKGTKFLLLLVARTSKDETTGSRLVLSSVKGIALDEGDFAALTSTSEINGGVRNTFDEVGYY